MSLICLKETGLTKETFIDYSKFDVYTEKNTEDFTFPLILSIPHSGQIFPEEFLKMTNRTISELRANEDVLVDELLFPLQEQKVTSIRLNTARAFLDVNRDKIELDENMFDDYPSDAMIYENNRCRSGFGLIHRIAADGKPIYKTPLKFAEVQKRIKNIYDVYHNRLNELISKCTQKFGYCFVIDCHSMPSKICSIMEDGINIDFCIGDLFQQSCPVEISNILCQNLENQGYSVYKNLPYSGAYTTFHYCKPRQKIYTLQLEINRSLYIDETTLFPLSSFTKIQKNLTFALLEFLKFLKI